MSIKSRLKGIGSGLALGAMIPLLTPLGLSYIVTGKTNGSGAGPALACFAAAVGVVVGGVILAGGAGLATLLSVGGVPWYFTVPGFYFLIWALIGAYWFGSDEKKEQPKPNTVTG